MLTTKPLIVIALAGIAMQIPALAAAQTPGSQRRLAITEARDTHQEQRIANGVAKGQLDDREAARLTARNNHIDNLQTRLASDGTYSRRDFARVSYRENRASRGIARARRR